MRADWRATGYFFDDEVDFAQHLVALNAAVAAALSKMTRAEAVSARAAKGAAYLATSTRRRSQ